MRRIGATGVVLAAVWAGGMFAGGMWGGAARGAEAKPEEVTYIDPAKAAVDPDFAIQGEYEGEVAGQKFGVQVVALGGGKFGGVGYRGGLPGAGWDGSPRIVGQGQREADGTVKLAGEQGQVGIVKDGVVGAFDPNGQPAGTLKRVVRTSPTLGAKPPEGAKVLFDGKTNDFKPGKTDGELLTQGQNSQSTFGSHTLHVEFLLPYKPLARGQGRGNSGVYLQGRYECQVLDSFGLKGENNECGGIYTIRKPDVNMCLPPLQWQTYDIDFTAATYEGGKKVKDATVTVRHNGVLIHENVPLPKTTTAAPVKEGPEPGPLHIQDHGNPVRFRNIWVVERR